jgi:hypothetical protein
MSRTLDARQSSGRWMSLMSLTFLFVVALLGALITSSCSDDDNGGPGDLKSSRSYQGHATDADINNFVRAYQNTVATRLDDCQTCHCGGIVMDDDQEDVQANPCDYCHYIIHPPEGWTGLPEGFDETLNPYGAAYDVAGRDYDAVISIANLDSDGDGYSNKDEIEDLRYPGHVGSYPGLEICRVITATLDEIKAMPVHTQFGLANAHKQQFDFYATYTGVKITDLLDAKGIDLTGATSIDILAPDGYARTFTISQIRDQFPKHRFFSGFGVDELGTDCAFVEYPQETHGYAYGDSITDEQWHILAYEREGVALAESYLEPASGRIVGEGPFRNVIPPAAQDDELNQPDRGKDWNTSGCTMPEWDYVFDKEHNAGSMVKATVIIRINPMPEGCEEFDIINGGWAMVDDGTILIYGHGVQAE